MIGKKIKAPGQSGGAIIKFMEKETTANKRKLPHYGWCVCLACGLLIVCTMGVSTNAFAVYLPYIEARGYSGVAGSALLSIRCLFSLAGMALVPLYYRRFSFRNGLALACLFSAAAFALYGVANRLLIYDLAAALAGIAYGLGSMIPVSILLMRWFVGRRAFAIGLCTTGTGLCTICFPPLITLMTEHFGLAAAFRAEALFILLGGAVTWLLVRNRPEDKGLAPYGAGEERAAVPRNTFNLEKRRWPLLLLAMAMLGGIGTGAPGHFSVLFTTAGYKAMAAASAISVFGLFLALGKLVYGLATDRFGGGGTSVAFLSFLAVGIVLCCLARDGALLPLYGGVLLMGFGFPLAMVGISVLSADFADPAHYPGLLKWLQIAYAAGGMVFSPLPGLLFDVTGTYVVSYLMFLAMTLLIQGVFGADYWRRRQALGHS